MGTSLLNAHSYGEQGRDSTNSSYCVIGNQFLKHIFSIDDTWLHSLEHKLKSQNSEWHTLSSPRPTNFKEHRNLITSSVIAYGNMSILLTNYDPIGQSFMEHVMQSTRKIETS